VLEVAVSLPAQLADRVGEALSALYRHPDQTLLAWYRYAIYDALLAEGDQASYAARAWIDVLSAQQVLFCWPPYARAGWPDTWPQPHALLELAEQTLRGTLDPHLAERHMTRAEALADVVGETAASAQYPAWCVFEAALRALQSAWLARAYGGVIAAPNTGLAHPARLDDASSYAAIAVAGRLSNRGAQHTRTADAALAPVDTAAQLRQTFFWEWWLREAIPIAWQRRKPLASALKAH
jgi:hypothetical protein